MSLQAAFIGVVLIWSTTPLAIKWSSEGAGFLFSISSRMVLGLFVCLVLVALMSRRMRWGRDALMTYLAGGLGMWGAMTSVYWGAQHISSGLVSVLFGFSPAVTALLAAVWLNEHALTPFRIVGMGLGLMGLVLIFGHNVKLGSGAPWGQLSQPRGVARRWKECRTGLIARTDFHLKTTSYGSLLYFHHTG